MHTDTLVRSLPKTSKSRFPTELLGVWRSVQRTQNWHRLEVLHGGLVLLHLASGISVTGKLECHSDHQCSLKLDLAKTLTLEGTWCLWHDTLDFNFLGEYLIFMPMGSNLQLLQLPKQPQPQIMAV
jgi:hypothetical protein